MTQGKPLFWVASAKEDLDTFPDEVQDVMGYALRTRRSDVSKRIPVEESSGNIFADLGRVDAEEVLVKVRLAQRIAAILGERGLSQEDAARVLGVDQPKVSKLVRGRLREFSTDRLLRFLTALDHDVEIVIRAKRRARKRARLSVVAA